MKVGKKRITKDVTIFISDDGKEFETSRECETYEYEQAIADAKKQFDFEFVEPYEDDFFITYRENRLIYFVTDISRIINNRWDVDSTNMAGEYEPESIKEMIEKELGEKLIDGHRYKFSGYLSYTDEDHPDDFCLDVDDITNAKILEQEKEVQKVHCNECKEALFDNQTTIDFCVNAKDLCKTFGKDIVKQILYEMVDDICKD